MPCGTGRPCHRMGTFGNAQHATATTRRGMRPAAPVVLHSVYPGAKARLQPSEPRGHDDVFGTENRRENLI